MIDLGIDLSTAVTVVIHAVAVIAAFLVLPLLVGQTEHKVMAHMQGRLGPMYAGGFHGWAQLIADAAKFVQKEATVPAAADRTVFRLAPAVALIPYMIVIVAIPLTPTIVGADLDAGLLFVLAVSAVGVLGTLMAGWSSANKYALMGALRSAAQLLSYELPIVLGASSVAMAAGTLSLVGIGEAWKPLWLITQAPAGFVFVIGGLAEIQRSPFDIPIADTELVVGPYTEYGGLRFALFLLAEYAGVVVLAGLTSVLFLGGWHGPGPDALGALWSLAKIGLVAVVVIWMRVSWPRFREDQLQRLAWGLLVPIALAQLALTSVLVVLGVY
jgi:NADH-quinone oxidoreductase subunit H